MSQQRLSNDEFLSSLTTLFTSTHAASHGSVYLTQKPLGADADAAVEQSQSSQILVRATNGLSKPHRESKTKPDSAKLKIATVVEIEDLDSFYARYAEVCKKGMEGLRKRDKKKAKEKAKAKKKGKSGAGAP
ncbi:hypothetical protein LTR10_014396 [Elasticomyces elasticus]|uniref:Signal recognition particle subunit SRP14 n=1 Tax=Exophiala sideris TaxID=1016849 RepID=A0ABR0J0Q6_9EURO|nr:hypothetical protein LTR10_014396 [Elasticomyces elasticus]KAK5023691.1 hypothetical protein LTS07_009199 [Exophiala sideris]KAK5029691.1 hypothetical protein LTR13_008611 [Exophiala sideris]KAK5053480.1 hypothetical protein LTR69_009438 [Exophiala sideris]KAK5179238.1 hypothetical protein LTR44_008392 [Eurotiomycetes sp. CCFEE 6388]